MRAASYLWTEGTPHEWSVANAPSPLIPPCHIVNY